MKKKFLSLIFLFAVVLNIISPSLAYATINQQYGSVAEAGDTGDDITPTSFVGRVAEDAILKLLCSFIVSLTQMARNLVEGFTKFVFGVEQFPWSDLIVFNTLPYLDVNFFNYNKGSLFEINGNVIGTLVKNLYYTILVICISLIGIGVGITAIRLAASTIASDKAKYKEAITKCIYTIVMLFSLHYVLSFLFYMNEQICLSASAILRNSLNQEKLGKIQENLNKVTDDNWLDEWIKHNALCVAGGWNIAGHFNTGLTWSIKGDEAFFAEMGGNLGIGDGQTEYTRTAKALLDRRDKLVTTYGHDLVNAVGYTLANSNNYDSKDKNSRFAPGGNYQDHYSRDGYSVVDGLAGITSWQETQKVCDILLHDVEMILSSSSKKELKNRYSSGDRDTAWCKKVLNTYEDYVYNENSTEVESMVSKVADAFLDLGYKPNAKSDEMYEPISIILYAVLMVQSLMLLFNYLKRVIFVTLLSLLGPLTIIYDFLLSAI